VLDPFYLIVDSCESIARLLPCGVRLVQLRIKDRPESTVRAEIAKAKALCVRHGARLIVNDYWQQAIDLGCDFIHLGQGDLDTADFAAIRRAGLRLGISTHDEAELFRALMIAPDYIALGPIYPTILKQMAFAPQGLPRVTQWKKKIGDIPLVAIGGISLERVRAVLEAGADSAAVVTDISLNAYPEQRTRDWVKATRGFCSSSTQIC
jgi:thiamine-phosphate pyrophosphorylase